MSACLPLRVLSASFAPDRPTFAGKGPFIVLAATKQAHLAGTTIAAPCRLVHDMDSPLRMQGISDRGHPVDESAWVLLRVEHAAGHLPELIGKHVRIEYV